MFKVLLTFVIIGVSFAASGYLAWYVNRRARAFRAKSYHDSWRGDGSDVGQRGGSHHGHHGGGWGGGDGGGHHGGGGGGGGHHG